MAARCLIDKLRGAAACPRQAAQVEPISRRTFNHIPYPDVTAVLNDSAKTLIVNVVNRHETNALASELVLQSGEFAGTGIVKQINAETVASANTRTREAVAITSKEIQVRGTKLSYTFPAHSFTQMLIPVK